MLEQALAEAGTGSSRVTLALTLAYVLANSGRLREAPPHAAAAVAGSGVARRAGPPGRGTRRPDDGGVPARPGIRRAGAGAGARARGRRTTDTDRAHADTDRHLHLGLYRQLCAGAGRARHVLPTLPRARRRGRAHPDDRLHRYDPVRGGRARTRARELVEDASERALQLGTPAARAIALGSEATLAGWTGDADTARRCARDSLALFESIGVTGQAFMTTHCARPPGALARRPTRRRPRLLVPPLERAARQGRRRAGRAAVAPDAIEALLALGRLEDARPLVRWLSERAEALGRPQLDALAARGRGLLLAAEGDLEGAEKALAEALDAHEAQPIRHERARTLLASDRSSGGGGSGARRASRSKRPARSFSTRRPPWAGAARRSSAGSGLRRSTSGDELTPSELRVAQLAARGLTNREVAADPVHQPEDGRGQSLPRLPQARDPLACRARWNDVAAATHGQPRLTRSMQAGRT